MRMSELKKNIPDENDETAIQQVQLPKQDEDSKHNNSSKSDLKKSSIAIDAILYSKEGSAQPVKNVTTPERKIDVPKFDLAEEIMAQHRKITAGKRKSPKAPSERLPLSSGQTVVIQESVTEAAKDTYISNKIVAEIVARDIAQLCGKR